MKAEPEIRRVGRRTLLRDGTLVLGAAAAQAASLPAADSKPALQIGLITDLHYADKPAVGTRHYRETLAKLAEASEQFAVNRPDFVVELGDLIDAADSVRTELRYLETINQQFAAVCADRHYVLGNHCVDTLRKEEFLDQVQQKDSFYSFDGGDFHFIVVDSCFRNDGQPYGRKNFKWTDANVSAEELEWLTDDLSTTDKQTVVFAHQRLDERSNHGVKNNETVRKIFEDSGKVLAVFQGHSHKNDLKEIAGIHYCTLVAMVEGSGPSNNGYSLLEIQPDGTIHLKGFRKQNGYDWQSA